MYSRASYSRTIEIRDWKSGGVDNMQNSNWFISDLKKKKSYQSTSVKMGYVESLLCAKCNTELLHYSGTVSELHATDPAEAGFENLT